MSVNKLMPLHSLRNRVTARIDASSVAANLILMTVNPKELCRCFLRNRAIDIVLMAGPLVRRGTLTEDRRSKIDEQFFQNSKPFVVDRSFSIPLYWSVAQTTDKSGPNRTFRT